MTLGWKTTALGDVCDIINRGIAPAYTDQGGMLVLNQKCIRDHVVNFSLGRRHDQMKKKVLTDRFVQIGDGLINSTGTGTLGRVAQVRATPPEPTTVDTHVTIVRPKSDLFYRDYFGYVLQFIESDLIASGEGASGQTELSRQSIGSKKISFPTSRSEQSRIVAMLDETFEAVAAATANAEKNLANAQNIFRSELRRVFSNDAAEIYTTQPSSLEPSENVAIRAKTKTARSDQETKTGGRAATTRHIRGDYSLSVGLPNRANRKGWVWSPLEKIARMESGHTPSRRCPEYWGGNIPWISIVDAKRAHGGTITETLEQVTADGIENSSARVLPAGTVCLSRTASVGYVTVMGRPMATSQDFVDWVCSEELEPNFLKYLLLAQDDELFKFSSGAVHQTIYFPEAKAFCIRHPNIEAQKQIANRFDFLKCETEKLETLFQEKISALKELKKSILAKAFAGKLATYTSENVIPFPKAIPNVSTTDLHAGILAIAYQKHLDHGKQGTFQHVKSEKIAHMVEAFAGIELGRKPMKDAAGPNDFLHLQKVQHRAERANFFSFKPGNGGFKFSKKNGFDRLVEKTRTALGSDLVLVEKIIDVMVPMDFRQAEIFATVYAAWNNLLLEDREISDDAIVRAARDDWHPEKLKIPANRFSDAIKWMRSNGYIPKGIGKTVLERAVT